MICHKKRCFIVISALFALVYAVLLIVFNGLIVGSDVLSKLAEEGEETLLSKFPIFEDLQVYIDGLTGKDAGTFQIATIILLVVGVLGFVFAIKALKKPIKADGSITYRGWIQFFTLVVSVVTLALCFLGSQQEALKDASDMLPTICLVFVGLAAASVAFEVFSLLVRKNVYKTKTVIKPNYKQNVALSVLGVEEKLKKIQQLKDVGVITEAQYNAAVIRIINGI